MRFKGLVVAVLAVMTVVACGKPPIEVDPEIARQIKSRQTGFQELGAAFKNLREELKLAKPSKRMIDSAVSQVQSYSRSLPNTFPAGTGPESGVKTASLPQIWTDEAAFRELFDRYQKAAEVLPSIAQSGDYAALSKEVESVGRLCKECHTKYRKE